MAEQTETDVTTDNPFKDMTDCPECGRAIGTEETHRCPQRAGDNDHDFAVMQQVRDVLAGESRPSKVRILTYLLRCYEEQTSD